MSSGAAGRGRGVSATLIIESSSALIIVGLIFALDFMCLSTPDRALFGFLRKKLAVRTCATSPHSEPCTTQQGGGKTLNIIISGLCRPDSSAESSGSCRR